eukprot:CAMPEP_0201506228 /NCGR_PEP_ID=MMETSP0161_2-20130828/157_1 /ASSEMBLY_ACC=CAM_ASM_000251 /TAXON_ID=180227 /ORGANISM="Neoparamoeba aestuarina, Strain SoJaBio B1-5/56/2" /LENGTH=99 /DNA_ID=CAMNT_0047900265 /DNA_START=73 /DNA_END=372 /DNA_ORIENTATION=+
MAFPSPELVGVSALEEAFQKAMEEIEEEGGMYAEIEIENMDYEEEKDSYFFSCPCGDRFQITTEQLMSGETIAYCPSCTLFIKVLYELEEFSDSEDEDE